MLCAVLLCQPHRCVVAAPSSTCVQLKTPTCVTQRELLAKPQGPLLRQHTAHPAPLSCGAHTPARERTAPPGCCCS